MEKRSEDMCNLIRELLSGLRVHEDRVNKVFFENQLHLSPLEKFAKLEVQRFIDDKDIMENDIEHRNKKIEILEYIMNKLKEGDHDSHLGYFEKSFYKTIGADGYKMK